VKKKEKKQKPNKNREIIEINENTLQPSNVETPVNSNTVFDFAETELNELNINLNNGTIIENDPKYEWKYFGPELDYGNIEYKLLLYDLSLEKIQKRITQMEFRLREGVGKCFYRIGLEDNGNCLGLKEEELKKSLETLQYLADQIKATMEIVKYYQGEEGLIAEVMITKEIIYEAKDLNEIKIALLGEEGSGKSTLVNLFNLLL
jgi:hypothetical protein